MFLILTNRRHALSSLMNKSRILKYISVTGLWAALVYQFVYPIFLGRLSSVTIFYVAGSFGDSSGFTRAAFGVG